MRKRDHQPICRSVGPGFEWPPVTSRSASVFGRLRRTLVACVAGCSSTELLAEETETTDGALMLTTAEELEEQWLTMTDCTDEGCDACESVSESDRFAFGASPASWEDGAQKVRDGSAGLPWTASRAALNSRRAAAKAALNRRRAALAAAQGCRQGSLESAQGSPAPGRATL